VNQHCHQQEAQWPYAIYKATGKRMYKQPFIEQEPLKTEE